MFVLALFLYIVEYCCLYKHHSLREGCIIDSWGQTNPGLNVILSIYFLLGNDNHSFEIDIQLCFRYAYSLMEYSGPTFHYIVL